MPLKTFHETWLTQMFALLKQFATDMRQSRHLNVKVNLKGQSDKMQNRTMKSLFDIQNYRISFNPLVTCATYFRRLKKTCRAVLH